MVNVKKCVDNPVHKPRLHCPPQKHPRCQWVNDYVCKRVPRLNKCGYRERQAPRCKRVSRNFISRTVKSTIECNLVLPQVPRKVCDPVYDEHGGEADEEPQVCKYLPPKEVCARVKVGVPKRVPRVRTTEYCQIPKDWRRRR